MVFFGAFEGWQMCGNFGTALLHEGRPVVPLQVGTNLTLAYAPLNQSTDGWTAEHCGPGCLRLWWGAPKATAHLCAERGARGRFRGVGLCLEEEAFVTQPDPLPLFGN